MNSAHAAECLAYTSKSASASIARSDKRRAITCAAAFRGARRSGSRRSARVTRHPHLFALRHRQRWSLRRALLLPPGTWRTASSVLRVRVRLHCGRLSLGVQLARHSQRVLDRASTAPHLSQQLLAGCGVALLQRLASASLTLRQRACSGACGWPVDSKRAARRVRTPARAAVSARGARCAVPQRTHAENPGEARSAAARAPSRVGVDLADAAQRGDVALSILWRSELGRLVAHNQRCANSLAALLHMLRAGAGAATARRLRLNGSGARPCVHAALQAPRRTRRARRLRLRPYCNAQGHYAALFRARRPPSRPACVAAGRMPPEPMAPPAGGIAVKVNELQACSSRGTPRPGSASRRRLSRAGAAGSRGALGSACRI